MKLSCEKAVLLEGLSSTIRAVAVKSPIPAMEGFLFQAEEHLTLTCYNSELGIRTSLGAMIQKPGSLVLPAKLTLDIVRSLPDDIVTIESDDSFTTTVSSGTYIRKLVEDIAERLGIIATLDDLTRLAVGEIGIDQCNSLEEVLNGNYYLTDPITLLRKRYFEVVVEDPKPYIDGKRVSIISDEDQVLITSGNEAIAIYERELGDTYRSKRGLF